MMATLYVKLDSPSTTILLNTIKTNLDLFNKAGVKLVVKPHAEDEPALALESGGRILGATTIITHLNKVLTAPRQQFTAPPAPTLQRYRPPYEQMVYDPSSGSAMPARASAATTAGAARTQQHAGAQHAQAPSVSAKQAAHVSQPMSGGSGGSGGFGTQKEALTPEMMAFMASSTNTSSGAIVSRSAGAD